MSASKRIICPFCFARIKARASSKRGASSAQFCPRCRSRIPEESFFSELFPIVVVGPSRAGKTHFLTVMAHQLLEDVIWPGYWTLTRVVRTVDGDSADPAALGASLSDDAFLEFEESLYPQSGAGAILRQTEKRDASRPPLSLVVHVRFEKPSSRFGREPYGKKDILLAFTDTAGEDLMRTGWGEILDKYPILEGDFAKGVIALLDPAELSGLRDDISANPVLKAEFAQVGIELAVQATIGSVLAIPEIRKKRATPLALCMTKSEGLAMTGRIAPDDPIAGAGGAVSGMTPDGCIDLSEIAGISDSVERFLAAGDRDGDAKISRAAANFRYRSFFAVDALGPAIKSVETDGGRRILKSVPSPRRILDPLLWLLWQHGCVAGRR